MARSPGRHAPHRRREEATNPSFRLALALVGFAAACSAAGRPEAADPGPPPPAAASEPAWRPPPGLSPGEYEPFEPPTAPPEETAPTGAAAATPAVAPGPEAPYVIQVAAFGEREAADDLVFLLRRRYPDYPTRVVTSAGLHRVWLGGWPTREEAASVLLIVRQRHADAWIVAP